MSVRRLIGRQLLRYREFLLVCLITYLAYSPGLSGDFVFDDIPNILENPQVQVQTLNTQSLWTAALSSDSGALRRPFSMLTIGLNYYLTGNTPYAFKFTNLIIHLLVGLGLLILTQRLLTARDHVLETERQNYSISWASVFITGVWLLHPLNLTSVLYVIQRMTSLATLFTVLGLNFYITGRKRMLSRRGGITGNLGGLICCGILAVLSKETGALLPLFILLCEITLFRFRRYDNKIDLCIVSFFVVIIAFPLVFGSIYLAYNPDFLTQGYVGRTFTPTERLLTELRVMALYIRLLVAPSTSVLGLYHDDIPVSHGFLEPSTTLYSLIGLSCLLVTSYKLRNRHPIVSLGLSWFLAAHVLESTILPLELAHEHRNYFASYGLLLALGSGLISWQPSFSATRFKLTVGVTLLVLLFIVTLTRAQQWSDNITHSALEAEYHPNSLRAVYAAGRIYANLAITGDASWESRALSYLERAQSLDKDSILPETALILFSNKLRKPIQKEWLLEANAKLATRPLSQNSVTSLRQLAAAFEVHEPLTRAEMSTVFANFFNNPAIEKLPRQHADALTIYAQYQENVLGDRKGAQESFEKCIRLFPYEPQYHINFIQFLIAIGEFDKAKKQLTILGAADPWGRFRSKVTTLRDQLQKQSISSQSSAIDFLLDPQQDSSHS